ncbi:hypothetical protein [Tsuneonella sp. SYSU-LHT278]|uniref:hypothetical protein n=1 Tax=Tsuneonella sediminis TaxID=3416089 RepID=UPI003F7AF841
MTTGSRWRGDRRTRFYRLAAVAAIGVAIAGFHLTYTVPMTRGTFDGPSWSHVHGALMAGWLMLVALQAWLSQGRLPLHRTIGWGGVVLAPLVALSTTAIGRESVALGLARGDGPIAYSGFLGTVTAPAIFLALVIAAIALRGKPQWHKRLIFVATGSILWPAWFRWRHFLPGMPRPEITLSLILADLPIVIAMVRDRLLYGAVHPAYLIAGIGLIAEQTFETLAFDTPAWRQAAFALYGLTG